MHNSNLVTQLDEDVERCISSGYSIFVPFTFCIDKKRVYGAKEFLYFLRKYRDRILSAPTYDVMGKRPIHYVCHDLKLLELYISWCKKNNIATKEECLTMEDKAGNCLICYAISANIPDLLLYIIKHMYRKINSYSCNEKDLLSFCVLNHNLSQGQDMVPIILELLECGLDGADAVKYIDNVFYEIKDKYELKQLLQEINIRVKKPPNYHIDLSGKKTLSGTNVKKRKKNIKNGLT